MMNRLIIAAMSAAGLLVTGCETMSGPGQVATAEECKATVVTSTAESMRMQNQQGVPTDDMRRTEGTLAMGKLRLNEPRVLRHPIAPEEGITSKTLRGC
jgi:hypothetical protein